MSRAQARKNISLDDFEQLMSGIFSTSVVETTLDESPGAYKPTDEIIRLIEPTVEILTLVKPKLNIKDTGK